MGFSALLLQSSGISCVGGAFGGAEHCSSSGSPLFGRPWPQPTRMTTVHIDPKFVVAAVRSEVIGGAGKREEEKQKKNQLLGVASASIGFNTVLLMSVTKPALVPASPRKDAPYSWLSLPLLAVWGAILVNAFVQFRILERLTWLPPRRESVGGRVDFTLNQRVAELEEDAREFITTARGLSKQVEKLGVRFRATKRMLRDPMQETAAIAQKTSEVANLLGQREDRLEEELRELQRALLAMQEHQVKQLALISLVLKRTQNSNNNSNKDPAKEELSSSVNGSSIKTLTDTHARKGGGEKASSAETPKQSLERESSSSSNGNSSTSATFSEESLSKIDFWKDSSASSSPPSVVVASPADKSSELSSFFNSRKQSSSSGKRSSSSSSPPEKASFLNAESESEPAEEYVEQPDYDSDSWLR